MKYYIIYALTTILIVSVALFGIRYLTNVSTPITVHQVKPGVNCAVATTSDGIAISCWKD